MQYLNIVDDESLRTVKPFPQPDSASQTVTIVATLQSYYEEMERDLDRRILMLINPLLATRVVQLYVAKVTDRTFYVRCAADSCARFSFLESSTVKACSSTEPKGISRT